MALNIFKCTYLTTLHFKGLNAGTLPVNNSRRNSHISGAGPSPPFWGHQKHCVPRDAI